MRPKTMCRRGFGFVRSRPQVVVLLGENGERLPSRIFNSPNPKFNLFFSPCFGVGFTKLTLRFSDCEPPARNPDEFRQRLFAYDGF